MVISDSSQDVVPKTFKVLFGGIAGMAATIVVHPLDMLKVRLQLERRPSSTWSTLRRLLYPHPLSLYAGLSAGLLRQATYTSTRLGVFNCLSDEYVEKYGSKPGLAYKVCIGLCAGLSGAMVGSPSEVVLIRMMADGSKPVHLRRYRNSIHALYEISRTEGLVGLWRGGLTNLCRAVIISVVQIVTYVQVYEAVKDHYLMKGYKLHLCSATVSSFTTACFSLPIDNIKTIYQADSNATNIRNVVLNIVKRRGVWGLYQGFVPYCARLTLHTSIAFFLLEELLDSYSAMFS